VAYSALTFKVHSTVNASEDFYVFASSSYYAIEWAPDGNTSNLCVSVTNKGSGVVLKTCAKTLQQTFKSIGGTGTTPHSWQSLANGFAVTDPNNGPAYTRAVMEPDGSSAGQVFTFINS
jgi:hypothetical protein